MMSFQLENGHEDTVLCVAINYEGCGRIISGGENGEICLWSQAGNATEKMKLDGEEDITSLCCSKRRPTIFYSSAGNHILGFDTRQLKDHFMKLSFNEDEINQIVMNEKEEYLAACDDSGKIKVIDLYQRRVYKTLRIHTNICATVVFRPKHHWEMYSGGYDSKLIQWDYSKGRGICNINMEDIGVHEDQPQSSYLVNPPFVHSIDISSNGQLLAAGTENAKVQLFHSGRRNLEIAQTLHGHTQGVSQVHFPEFNEETLVTGGNDGQILVWNVARAHEASCMTNGTIGTEQGTAESENNHIPTPTTIEHGSKINWIVSGNNNNQKVIVVADNTNIVTVYPFPIH